MRLLFTAGTARGGTNFRTLILNNHSQIRMSLDPFIPLFRYFRDSLLQAAGAGHLLTQMPSAALDDYYFSDIKITALKTLQNVEPDIPFNLSGWEKLKPEIASRMKLASMDLIPHLDKLPAPTFRQVFLNTMQVIRATSEKELEWVGFNDNWTAEFLPILAKLIPDAKFMLHLRDPRAVVFSSEFAEPDPAKRPTVLSFARHLRKYYAFASMLPSNRELCGRLLITHYEPFIENPKKEAEKMVKFLNLKFEPSMVKIDRFRKADGRPWPSDWSIYKSSDRIWKKEMPKDMAELVEFVCDPEMRLHGYLPENYDRKKGLSLKAFAFAVQNSKNCLGWRTDFPEVEQTLGGEFFREYLLKAPSAATPEVLERCFLFQEVFQKLKKKIIK